MGPLFTTLLWAGLLPGAVEGGSFGYLYRPSFEMDYELRQPVEPYYPQPGDLFLATNNQFLYIRVGHLLAGTAAPHNSGLVVRRSNGRLAIFESGPVDNVHVELIDLDDRLLMKVADDRVWIRRRKVPLTPEQSARLTAFAEAQTTKRFAFWRMAAQMTPIRNRGPLRTWFLGKPRGERPSYYCTELVLETCVAVGLLDRETTRPSATYPRDLFFGTSPNPYLRHNLKINDGWHPPARWTDIPGK